MYLGELFYAVENADIFNFADDTTPRCSSNNINEAIRNIDHHCPLLVEWFCDSFMTLNASKCHLLVADYKYELIFASVEDALLWEE